MGISAYLIRSRRATAVLALASAALGSQAMLTTASAREAHTGSGGAGLDASGVATTNSGTTTSQNSAGTTTTNLPVATTTGSGVIGLNESLQASGDGITLTLADFGTLHRAIKLTGSAAVVDAGATVEVEVAPASGVQAWTEVTSAIVSSTGGFSAAWVPSQSTTYDVKAVVATSLAPTPSETVTATTPTTTGGAALPDAATAASDTSGPAIAATGSVMLPIFTDAVATMYGPGLWGRHTACGEVLKRATLGVASRTLKCGTMVAVQYGGRELSVPVIDRGPFANHASWDLTMAAARLLGVRETSTVGTLSPAPAALLSAVRAHR